MVTELMSGGDVEGVIEDATDHRLPLEHAIDIAKQTCRGLEFANSRGIAQRDLKPGNVWLTGPSAGSGQAFGTAKIGDFGLAGAIDRSRLTMEGMMVGTPTLTLHPDGFSDFLGPLASLQVYPILMMGPRSGH